MNRWLRPGLSVLDVPDRLALLTQGHASRGEDLTYPAEPALASREPNCVRYSPTDAGSLMAGPPSFVRAIGLPAGRGLSRTLCACCNAFERANGAGGRGGLPEDL